jgi:ADP-ribose pyrophosphatase YjhB (NUDIX family)
MHSKSLKYAQMRPKGVESNHFAYHLDQLLKAKIIQKTGRDYSLTNTGLTLVDRSSHKNIELRKQPHIVTTVCVVNEKGKFAVFKHNFQPYIGLVGFSQGRTKFDETIGQSATRELFEKTGLQGVGLTHRGTVYITAKKDNEIISKILSHVFYGKVSNEPELLTQDPSKGEPFWLENVQSDHDFMPGFIEINKLLDTGEPNFFNEIVVAIK